MELDYFVLISGDSVYIDNVGHFHSPYLYELKQNTGIGLNKYSFYINLLASKKEEILRFLNPNFDKGSNILKEKIKKLEYYDIMSMSPLTLSLLKEAISFFMDKNEILEIKEKDLIVYNQNKTQIGVINKQNFEQICDVILQLNYMKKPKQIINTRKENKITEYRWSKVQEYLEKEEKIQDNKYSLGNIISKICSLNNSYNLLNVFDLTIYQLYDQFFQISYLKANDLKERIFSIHGDKNFKFEDWLNKIEK